MTTEIAIANNKNILAIIEKELEKEVMLRKKYEVSSDRTRAFKHSHRAAALRDLLKKIAILLLISGGLQAQKRDNFWLKQGISATTAFTSGFFFRRAEIRKDDYRRYSAIHPNADPKWANPRKSQYNKFKNPPSDLSPKFFGSTTFLVGFTDGFHNDNMIAGACFVSSMGFSMSLYEKPKVKTILAQCLISWFFYASGRSFANMTYPKI